MSEYVDHGPSQKLLLLTEQLNTLAKQQQDLFLREYDEKVISQVEKMGGEEWEALASLYDLVAPQGIEYGVI